MAGRTDRASRFVAARPAAVYRAFVDPEAWIAWLPPAGMSGRIEHFEPKPGGRYRMTLTYDAPEHYGVGKSSEHEDTVEGEFVRLSPDREVVQRFVFELDDPDLAGVMTMTWMLEPAPAGTRVSIVCENVPVGISAEDHAAGLASSLENLAAYCEADANG